jgi:hypothetical protein
MVTAFERDVCFLDRYTHIVVNHCHHPQLRPAFDPDAADGQSSLRDPLPLLLCKKRNHVQRSSRPVVAAKRFHRAISSIWYRRISVAPVISKVMDWREW